MTFFVYIYILLRVLIDLSYFILYIRLNEDYKINNILNTDNNKSSYSSTEENNKSSDTPTSYEHSSKEIHSEIEETKKNLDSLQADLDTVNKAKELDRNLPVEEKSANKYLDQLYQDYESFFDSDSGNENNPTQGLKELEEYLIEEENSNLEHLEYLKELAKQHENNNNNNNNNSDSDSDSDATITPDNYYNDDFFGDL